MKNKNFFAKEKSDMSDNIFIAYASDVERIPTINKKEELKRAMKIESTRRDLERFAYGIPEIQREVFAILKKVHQSKKSGILSMRTSTTEPVDVNADIHQSLSQEEVLKRIPSNLKTLTDLFDKNDDKQQSIRSLLLETPVNCTRKLCPLIEKFIEKEKERNPDICRQLLSLQDKYHHAKNDLVEPNLRLVVYWANKENIKTKGLSLMDLIQGGNIGLMHAAEKYEHRKGYTFSTYATHWIKSRIDREKMESGGMIHVPLHAFSLMHAIDSSEFYEIHGRFPGSKSDDIETLLHVTNLTREEIETALQAKKAINITPNGDASILKNEDVSLRAIITDKNTITVERQMVLNEMKIALFSILKKMKIRDQIIVKMRFGIALDPKQKTLVRGCIKLRNSKPLNRKERDAIREMIEKDLCNVRTKKKNKAQFLRPSKYGTVQEEFEPEEDERDRYLGTIILKNGYNDNPRIVQIWNEKECVLDEIAAVFGFTRERTRQIENRTVKNMLEQSSSLLNYFS